MVNAQILAEMEFFVGNAKRHSERKHEIIKSIRNKTKFLSSYGEKSGLYGFCYFRSCAAVKIAFFRFIRQKRENLQKVFLNMYQRIGTYCKYCGNKKVKWEKLKRQPGKTIWVLLDTDTGKPHNLTCPIPRELRK